MPTHKLIASYTFPSDAGSYTFSSIPSTYTDLKLVWSQRQTGSSDCGITFNGSTSGYQYRSLFFVNQNSGVATSYGGNVTDKLVLQYFWLSGSIYNAGQMYITNYASATPKSIWTDNAQPSVSNATNFSCVPMSHNWNSTATISSITMSGNGSNIAAGTKLYLYGISNS